MDAPEVVFILATNYAGSHLLAQLLAAHSRCAGVGELHNYRKFRERGSRSGNVVNDYQDHAAFADLEGVPIGDWHATVMARLRSETPQLTHLIDNSKRPEWASRFPAANAHLLHLIRDPRALVNRWLNTYVTARAQRRQWLRVLRPRPWLLPTLRDPIDVYVQKWLIANRRIRRFTAGRPRAGLLTYYDLAHDTERTLGALMPVLGLSFEPAQLDYGAAGGALGTRKRDYQQATATSAIQLDLRWREQLDDVARNRIERHRGVQHLLRDLGLHMTDRGLTCRNPR